MIGAWLDSAIGVVFPGWGAKRTAARIAMRHNLEMISSMQPGYQAGKDNRLSSLIKQVATENSLPLGMVQNLRARSRELWRNNPQARKACRSLGAKVIGNGMKPQSQATTADDKPFLKFRNRVKKLWRKVSKEIDYRGRPGMGGHHLATLGHAGINSMVLDGSFLISFRRLNRRRQLRKKLTIPLQLQMIGINRLDHSKNDDQTFRGIELGPNDERTGYWLHSRRTLDGHLGADLESEFVPAKDVRHIYVEEEIDQIDGIPWIAGALMKMQDRGDYEFNELTASKMAACFVAAYRRSSANANFGLPFASGGESGPLTDADGNPVTQLSPGMICDLGATGNLELLNPNRPNNAIDAFLNYLMRVEAAAIPGMKSSTMTMDYRNSSFSSERSADNDAWPELEVIQEWLVCNFYQHIYEEVISAAVMTGYFDDIEGFSMADFNARPDEYLSCNWQGPVARSINPKDDVIAAAMRISKGLSSLQKEAAKLGYDWRELLDDMKEAIDFATELGLPEAAISSLFGVVEQSEPAESPPNEGATTSTESEIDTVLEDMGETIIA